MLIANQLRKSYGHLEAVNNLSFEIHEGEIFGLLGPNGAGKTTTISMLTGLLRPDSGEVAIESQGRSGDPQTPSIRRMIGVAPQALSLYMELTARENLDFFASLYGITGRRQRERRAWALEFSGLEDRQNDRVSTFSGGMKRRLNIAVAMLHEPQILLLDEPTVGVDPQSRHHIFDSIRTLNAEGLTILYTTHYMEEAQRLCDRVAIVDQGRLLTLDTVPELIKQYGSRSVVTAEVAHFQGGERPAGMDGNQLRFEAVEPLKEIAELHAQGVEFQTLNIAGPDLESVFLKLTGRSLRD